MDDVTNFFPYYGRMVCPKCDELMFFYRVRVSAPKCLSSVHYGVLCACGCTFNDYYVEREKGEHEYTGQS